MTSDPYRTGIRVDAEPESRIPDCIRLSPLEYLRREKARLEVLVPPKEYQTMAQEEEIQPPEPWYKGLALFVPTVIVFVGERWPVKNQPVSVLSFPITLFSLSLSVLYFGFIAIWKRRYSRSARAYQAWLDAGQTWSRTSTRAEELRLEKFPLTSFVEGTKTTTDAPLLLIVYERAIRDLVHRYVGELGPYGQFLTGSGSGPLHKRLNFITERMERLEKTVPHNGERRSAPQAADASCRVRSAYYTNLHEARQKWNTVTVAIAAEQQFLLDYARQLATTVHTYGMNATLAEQAQINRLWIPFSKAYIALDEYLALLPLDREDSVPSDTQLNNIPRLQDTLDEMGALDAPRQVFKKGG